MARVKLDIPAEKEKPMTINESTSNDGTNLLFGQLAGVVTAVVFGVGCFPSGLQLRRFHGLDAVPARSRCYRIRDCHGGAPP